VRDLKRKTIKGVAWSSIETWSDQGISLLVFILLARILEPKDFGLMALASIYIAAMQMVIKQGLTEAIVQKEKLESQHLDAVFWVNLLLGAALALFTFFFAPWVAALFGNPELANIIQTLSAALLLGSLSTVQSAVMQREMRYRALALRTLTASGIAGVVAITLALLGYGIWSLVAYQLVNAFISFVILWTAGHWRPSWRFSIPHCREMFRFGVNIFALNVVDVVNKRSDQFLIGLHLGPVALGFFSISTRFYQALMTVFVSSINRVALSTFARLQTEPARFVAGFYRAIEAATTLSFPAFLGATILCPEIITLCFGAKWLECVPVFRAMMCMGLLYSLTFFHGAALRAMGKPHWHLYLVILHVAINLVLFLTVVKHGIAAVALAATIRAYVLMPVDFIVLKKVIPIRFPEYWRRIQAQVFASIGMVGAIYALKSSIGQTLPWTHTLTLSLILGVLVYTSLLYLLHPQLFKAILGYAQMLKPRRPAMQSGLETPTISKP